MERNTTNLDFLDSVELKGSPGKEGLELITEETKDLVIQVKSMVNYK